MTTISFRTPITNFAHDSWTRSPSIPALLSRRSTCLTPLFAVMFSTVAYALPIAWTDRAAACRTPVTPFASERTRIAWRSSPNSSSTNSRVCSTPSVRRRALEVAEGRSDEITDERFMHRRTHAAKRKFLCKEQTRGSLRTSLSELERERRLNDRVGHQRDSTISELPRLSCPLRRIDSGADRADQASDGASKEVPYGAPVTWCLPISSASFLSAALRYRSPRSPMLSGLVEQHVLVPADHRLRDREAVLEV